MHTGMAPGPSLQAIDAQELYQTLVAATSQDPQAIRQSGDRLKELLGHFGAFDALQSIAAERSVPLPVRQQAIIQFKNTALNSWRNRRLQNEEHKAAVRARCLGFIEEPDQTIADCNQVIVARIARNDFPQHWPDLTTSLLSIIDTNLQQRYSSQSEDPLCTLRLQRSLQLLGGVVREFAAYKMLTGVKTMAALVDQLHGVLYGYYATISSTFTSVDGSSTKSFHDVALAHQVYKIVARIAVWLWQRSDKTGMEAFQAKQEWFYLFFTSSASQVRALLQLRMQIISTGAPENPQSRAFIEVLTKHIRHIGKFFRHLSRLSQTRFVELPGCAELVIFYWEHVVSATSAPADTVADSPFVLYPVRILVQGMVLFKENLGQWTVTKKNGTPNANTLSQTFVQEAIQVLIVRLLPLKGADLQAWTADPEEWVTNEEKESDQWEYEVRACAERLLMHICNRFSEFVVPLLQSMFNELAGQQATDLSTILQKEAMYCAIGRCAHHLQDFIPFEQWTSQTLVAEAQSTNADYPIIKRRIAWLIGKWTQVAKNPNVPVCWQTLVHLLSNRGPGTDTVVRLTAGMALRECVDTTNFDMNAFEQYLPLTVVELMRLIIETDTLENKRRVSESLNVVIVIAGERIIPLVDTIAQPLPEIWTDAGDEILLKATLLHTVAGLVNATKGASPKLSHIIVPMIRNALQKKMELDEDGLALWKAALQNCPDNESVQIYLDLVPEALAMLEDNLDVLCQVNDIVEAYILLAGTQILQVCGLQLFQAYVKPFKMVAITAQRKDLLLSIHTIVATTPSSLWGEVLHTSGLFAYLVNALLDSEIVSYVLAEHVYIFSRIALVDTSMFLQLMTHTAPKLSMPEAKLWDRLLDAWWDKFDAMAEPRHRKLCAMGIASLVGSGKQEVLERLKSDWFNMWLDVFGEIKESLVSPGVDLDEESHLKRNWEVEDPPHEIYRTAEEGSPEYARRKLLWDNDPVRTVKLSLFVGQKLREAEMIYGSDTFRAQFLATADSTVLAQIEKEVTA
ncbi:ARM repeat-containing protein [Cylindrobasidium torrendii FP15055 ss-10]|uniref:ARM repeat-containing protein n=1 Tax=Cylindrobasidium torrendii FP15055 ss-10 TaxID=1314674 RepID=A0A0D7BVE7_9AGAR|nr:ARM repeat-containing protein [Cylindrobasidium torrendii FP15055 ss-10]